MTWHKHGIRKDLDENGDPMLVHPSDGDAWKAFDRKHTEKAKEPRNCRIAIGMTATQYSCWHVFVIPLNLPPSSIMQRKHIFLTLIVPGPNYPGKNMSVYMQPLMDDLKEARVNGVNTYDATKKENFQMYVWYQYLLHDLPAFALFVA